MSSFGYHFQHHPSTASSGNRSRRNPHRPSSTKSFQMMRPKEELTDIPAVPTFIEKFEAGRSFEMEDDFAFIPELCTEEEVWDLLSEALIYAYLFSFTCSVKWWTSRVQIVHQTRADHLSHPLYNTKYSLRLLTLTLPHMRTCSTPICIWNIKLPLRYLQDSATPSPLSTPTLVCESHLPLLHHLAGCLILPLL